MAGIRRACGEQFLIIFRLSLLDLVRDGSTWDENRLLAAKLEQAGADLFNTGIGWHEARVPTIATCVPRAAFAEFTARLKAVAGIPVIATNRINMPATAEAILATGQADAVCLARPLLADADWVAKAEQGQDAAINTCIACNQACLDHLFSGHTASCLVNPFAGHETQMPLRPAARAKNIAVIGAGPAGIAFADTAARRGHRITLIDRQSRIGGQLNLAKTIPGKAEFQETLRYFTHRLNHECITLRLNTDADPAVLEDFDEIVLASGVVPRRPPIEGIDHPKVLGYLNVLRDRVPVGKRVAIIGAGGIGFDTAAFLAHHGSDSALHTAQFHHEWQIDTSLQQPGALLAARPALPPAARQIWLLQRTAGSPGKQLGKTTGWIHRLSLANQGVQLLGGVHYQKIDDQGLHIRRDGADMLLPADHIVICAGQEPQRELETALRALGKPLHLIGGADEAGELDAKRAIRAGTELALRI